MAIPDEGSSQKELKNKTKTKLQVCWCPALLTALCVRWMCMYLLTVQLIVYHKMFCNLMSIYHQVCTEVSITYHLQSNHVKHIWNPKRWLKYLKWKVTVVYISSCLKTLDGNLQCHWYLWSLCRSEFKCPNKAEIVLFSSVPPTSLWTQGKLLDRLGCLRKPVTQLAGYM